MNNAGLIGLISKAKALRADPLAWIIRLVAAAALILIWKKSGAPMLGWETAAVTILLGVAALMGEFYLTKEATRAYHERAASAMLMFALLWGGAFVYSINQWLGVASEGQFEKAGVQKAAFRAGRDASAEKEFSFAAMNEQRAAVERIKAERWKALPTVDGKVVGSAAEARAIIDGLKGNSRFWTMTEGCTKSNGPQTRAFVKTCTEAKAAIAAAETRDETGPALADAEKLLAQRESAFKDASARADLAPKAVSGERSDLRIYTNYLGMSQEAAMDLQAMGTIVFVSLLLSGLGILVENKEHRGKPKRAWPFMIALRRLLFGRREDEAQPDQRPATGANGVTNIMNRTVNTFVDPFCGKALAHNGV